MTVLPTPDGEFVVVADSSRTPIAGPFATNRDAWRWIDRHDREPISRAEQTSGWLWDRKVNGE